MITRAVAVGLVALMSSSLAAFAAEDFKGFIIDTAGGVPGRSSNHFQLHVDEYTTLEEAQKFADLLVAQGPEAVLKALRKIERGYIQIGGRLGYGSVSSAASTPRTAGSSAP